MQIISLKEKLESLIDSNGLIKDEIKSKITHDFCESFDGEGWFMELSMPMIMDTLTELIKGMWEMNLQVILPNMVNTYYEEGAKWPEFP